VKVCRLHEAEHGPHALIDASAGEGRSDKIMRKRKLERTVAGWRPGSPPLAAGV